MTAASIDVVIVSHNTREDVLRCVASIDAARADGIGQIVLVDNASSDGTVDAVRRTHPGVRVLALDRNAGFAAANNAAIRIATAPLVLLLNPDTVVSPGSLATLAARLASTQAVAAGPRLVDGDGRPEVSWGRMLSPLAELGQAIRVRVSRSENPLARRVIERRLARERVVDWVSGACLLVRRQAALDAGLLDERYFLYEEDVDFCAALRARGGRVLFTPAATVTHLRGRAMRATGAGVARAHYDRSHLAFYEKHRPGWARWLRLWQRLRGAGPHGQPGPSR
jgi:GT2 family glycosyltransferase